MKNMDNIAFNVLHFTFFNDDFLKNNDVGNYGITKDYPYKYFYVKKENENSDFIFTKELIDDFKYKFFNGTILRICQYSFVFIDKTERGDYIFTLIYEGDKYVK